jgi:hypothetical protein
MPVLLEFGSTTQLARLPVARSWKLLLAVAGGASTLVAYQLVSGGMATARGRFRANALYVATCATCAGCASPNLYTTPRAAPVGKFTSVLALQLVRRPELREQANSLLLAGRVGLAPRLDGGVRTNFASIAGDIKWNAIRTRYFDLALDGGVEIMPETFYVDMPVMLGINVSEAISILPNTGITLGEGTQPSMSANQTYDDGLHDRPPAGRLLIRAGIGTQFRFSPTFAVEPEFTYVGPADGGEHGTSEYFAAGIGFCFGPQSY